MGVPGRVAAIEYDPGRSSRIALIFYRDGEKRYIVAPVGLKVGEMIQAGPESEVKVGNTLPLQNMPNGTVIHNIELTPGRGGQIVRSAGTSAQLMAKEGDYTLLRLPSGEMRRVLSRCLATVGQVGNVENSLIKLGKAGRTAAPPAPPAGARRGDEPERPPARWWRGQGADRHAEPEVAVGQADAGQAHTRKASDKFIVRRRKA